MAKNKQQIKFEADVSEFKANIKEAEKSITNLNNQLKLNQSQLKGNADDSNLLQQRIQTLKGKYEEQTKVVENTRRSYEKAVEMLGENSKEAENLKNKLLQAETAQQNIKNEIDKTNQQLIEQTNNLAKVEKAWQESGEALKDYGSKIDNIGDKLSIASGIVAGAGIVSIKSAIGVETSIQQIENIYEEASDTIKDFAENTAISFNMSKSEAYKYSQVFGNLIQSITDDQSKNAQYTQQLLQASAVIASATGRSMEDVMDRIRSGLLGNTEAIEDLGVNVNVALLQTTDAFKQIAGDKSWEQLDFQTQQQIRLFAILEQTTKKYGTEINKNTNTSIQQLSSKTKNLVNDFGQKLLPTANKVIDKANDLVDSFGNLSDKEQENIIKIGTLVVALGPALKIGGNLIKTIGYAKTSVGTLTGAIGLLKNGIGDATGASATLAKGMKNLINPFTIVTASIGAAYLILESTTKETGNYAKECKNAAERMSEEKKAIDDLKTSIDNKVQSDLENIDRSKALWEELQKITDENGKIKEGYENRAKVITGDLSEALGTEISITDNVIDKYKDLQAEIDNLILKKKGEVILSGAEEKWSNATNNRTQKAQELIDKENEYNDALAKRDTLYNELTETEKRYYKAISENRLGSEYFSKEEMDSISYTKIVDYDNTKKSVESLKKQYDDLDEIVKGYTRDIEDYQYKYELYAEGTTDSIQKMVDSAGKTYEKNGKNIEVAYERQIKVEQNYLLEAKKRYEEAEKNNDESEKKKSQTTIDESNRRLQSIVQELKGITSATEENSPEIIEAWKQLANNSFEIYSEEVGKFPVELRNKIEEMTGVFVEETPEISQRTQSMGEAILNKMKQSTQFKQEALNNLKGYLQGLNDEELRSFLKEAGVKDVEVVIQGIRDGNLGEEEGIDILTSLYKGLSNNSWQGSIYQTAKGIASKLSSLLNVKATVEGSNLSLGAIVSKLPGHKDGLSYVPYDNYVARLHKGERVLTAEENEQYMSNLQNKVATRNITVQFYPQTMTEAELQRAEKYISRKWGLVL